MRNCLKCQNHIPYSIVIEGKRRNLKSRIYCLTCSPFGNKNTRKLHVQTTDSAGNKICGHCKTSKSVKDFHKKNSQTTSWCKRCLHDYQMKRWILRKIEAIKILGGKCCGCGYNKNYAALEFHHKDPTQKDLDWTKNRQRSWDKVLAELNKCILLCANCHRETHNPQALFSS